MDAREIAWQVLNQVCLEKEYANLALRKVKLQGADMAFVTQVVYGTLQHYRYVRYLWEGLVKSKPKSKIAVLLDMSVYQLMFLHTPTYAIIHEAVDLAKQVYQGRYAKLVNALLHQVERAPRALPQEETARLAIETSHPDWLLAMWKAQYGAEIMKQIAYHDIAEGKTWIRCNTLVNSLEELEAAMPGRLEKAPLPQAYAYLGKQLLQEPCFRNGGFAIGDLSSQMVAGYLDPKPHETILDVCSAPGGKACHMAALMENKGKIIACDLHAHRVKLIEEGAKRLHVSIIEAKVLDALQAQTHFSHTSFDRILCDVPCSGYGVLQGKSDIKYHMQSSDMDAIIKTQEAILESVWPLVKVHGVLVYSTCTLNKKENEKQIAAFLSRHPQFQLEKEQTIFPFIYNSDGFYMAKLCRIA